MRTQKHVSFIVLLVDERPEEVPHFQRTVEAEVLASSNDESLESHINLAELTMAHVRCEFASWNVAVMLWHYAFGTCLQSTRSWRTSHHVRWD